MKTITQIKLFISCPSDIKQEIESINFIINEINKTSGRNDGYILESLNWNVDTYTDIASDAQQVINNQLEEQYDILIGILWTKAGTPTKRDKSGTIEEINRAITNTSKEQLIYFRTSAPENIYDIDSSQLQMLKDFKESLSTNGVLYKEYNTIESFETLFRINLITLISNKILNKEGYTKLPTPTIVNTKNEKYSEIYDLISEVEGKGEELIETDMFDVINDGVTYLNNITFSLQSMTKSLEYFTQVVSSRTAEVNKFNNIKDVKLKNNRIQNSVNHLAEELLEFNKRIDDEIPIFSENFSLSAKSYADIFLIFGKKSETAISIKENIYTLREGVKNAIDTNANFLKTVMNLPLINAKFNNSKRLTEISLKNMIKEMLNGLQLLDELLEN